MQMRDDIRAAMSPDYKVFSQDMKMTKRQIIRQRYMLLAALGLCVGAWAWFGSSYGNIWLYVARSLYFGILAVIVVGSVLGIIFRREIACAVAGHRPFPTGLRSITGSLRQVRCLNCGNLYLIHFGIQPSGGHHVGIQMVRWHEHYKREIGWIDGD